MIDYKDQRAETKRTDHVSDRPSSRREEKMFRMAIGAMQMTGMRNKQCTMGKKTVMSAVSSQWMPTTITAF